MLFKCWPTVFDAGPTLKQHRVDVPCLLGRQRAPLISEESWQSPFPKSRRARIPCGGLRLQKSVRRTAAGCHTLRGLWRKNWPNAGLMLGRRRRRRANINPALCQCIVFVDTAVSPRQPHTAAPHGDDCRHWLVTPPSAPPSEWQEMWGDETATYCRAKTKWCNCLLPKIAVTAF